MFTPVLEIPAETPRRMILTPPLSDEEFERLCERNELARLERTGEGTIVVHAPAGGNTSSGNSEVTRQLRNWWIGHRRGQVFDSSAGFFLPDGSMLNPDAAYATAEQIRGLTREDRARFLRLTPAFVVELLSPSDRLAVASQKMESWMANGAELGWLVDPASRKVTIYEAGASAPRLETGSSVAGTGPVAGFVLDLEEVWRCYE